MQKIVQLPPPNRGYRTYISEATGMSCRYLVDGLFHPYK